MKRLFTQIFLTLPLLVISFGCGNFGSSDDSHVKVNLKDTETRQILDWQDKQLGDSLISYLSHPKATFRYLSAMAFGSIRKIQEPRYLQELLSDPVDSVRMAAAYAMGQIGDSTLAPMLAQAFDTSRTYFNSKQAILEAVGKCAPATYLDSLVIAQNYTPDAPKAVEGLVRGIYRFGLRGITSPQATEKVITILEQTDFERPVRLMAAHYLFRSAEGLEAISPERLGRLFTGTDDPAIRMALAGALGKSGKKESLDILASRWDRETDYRVRCNMLRALGNLPFPESIQLAQKALQDPNPAVSQVAASYFVANGTARGAYQYWRWSRDSFPDLTRALLGKATLRHLSLRQDTARRVYSNWIRQQIALSSSDYVKASWISALSEQVWNYRFLYRTSQQVESPVIRTACLSALRGISDREDFDRIFGTGRRRVTRELAAIYLVALRSEDAGMIAEAAGALRNPDRDFKTVLADSVPALQTILESLPLPELQESYQELERTIRFIQGAPAQPIDPPAYNHPIDWNRIIISIPRNATILTTKGDIQLELFPEEAPGSVVNFVNLAEMEFYNQKTFHRVVPNFVIQGGCPRGDGYGSLDYSIRSELDYLHYDQEGILGMASAGNHTEGTQFFITHSPTPHLDGGYTIFGRVSEGMDVVHQIEPGDQILEIQIQ